MIATRKGTLGGDPVVLEVFQPRRRGVTVVLDLRLTSKDPDAVAYIDDVFDDGVIQRVSDPDAADLPYEGYSLDGISLIDGANGRRYLVARDRYDRCVCDTELGGVRVEAAESLRLSAVFGAPPADVTRVDVVIPRFGTLADVALG